MVGSFTDSMGRSVCRCSEGYREGMMEAADLYTKVAYQPELQAAS